VHYEEVPKQIRNKLLYTLPVYYEILPLLSDKLFGSKNDEVTEEWRRLHNEELYALYSSANIIRVIESRRMDREGHVARMGERRGAYRVLLGKPEGRNHLKDPGVDGRIILKFIFEKWDGGVEWVDLAQDRDS
jgi:hypothetical protein